MKKYVAEIRKKFTFWFPFQSATLEFTASSLSTILSVCSSSSVVQSGNFLLYFTCLGLLFVFLVNNLSGLAVASRCLRCVACYHWCHVSHQGMECLLKLACGQHMSNRVTSWSSVIGNRKTGDQGIQSVIRLEISGSSRAFDLVCWLLPYCQHSRSARFTVHLSQE